MHLHRSVPVRLLLPALAAVALATPTRAGDFFWNRTDTGWYNWSDPANWTDASGNAVAAAPGAGDTIADHARAEKMSVDLGNGTVSIVDWTWTDNAHNDAVAIRNGTLAVTGKSTFRQATVDLYDASFTTVDGEFAYNWGGRATINVHDGSSFTVSGNFWPRIMNVNVDAGGAFVYASTAVAQNCNYNNDFVISNSGLCDWPDGFRHFNNAWSFRPYFKQLAGEWRLGGNVTYQNNLFWRIELTGGKVSATGDVSFDIHADNASAFAKFTDGADVELAVASGKTLDLSNFAYENAAAVAKTGAGTLKLPGLPSTLRWREGAIDFTTWTRTAFDELETGAGVTFPVRLANTTIATLADNKGTLAISKPGLTVSSVAAGATLSGSVTVDLADFSAGSVVVSTPDATLRAQVKAAAEAAATATGDVIEEDGDAVKIGVGGAAYAFTSTTITDLSNAAGWSGGVLPPAGADVVVVGAGVVGTLNAGAPVWNSIVATGGATLRLAVAPDPATAISVAADSSLAVGAGVTVSSLYGATAPAFEPGSALAVAPGGTLALPSDASFSATSAADLPTLTVPATSTLQVPGGYGFRNVNLVLNGVLEATSDGPIAFGTAGAGETAWFAMTADGATVAPQNAAHATNGSKIRFLCPEAGGAVVADAPLVVTNCTFAYSKYDGFDFGANNPTNRPAEVRVYGTDLATGDAVNVAGAVRLVVGAGATLGKSTADGDRINAQSNYFNVEVEQRGVLEIADGGALVWPIGGNGGDGGGWIRLRPDETGFVSFVLGDGARAIYQKAGDGNGKAVVSAGNATYGVSCPAWWGRYPEPFRNCAAVELAAGKTLTWTRANVNWGSNQNPDSDGAYAVGTTPFTGGGSLSFANERPASHPHELTFAGTANTATGLLSVADDRTTLHFADGAVWAGTVAWNSGRMDVPGDAAHALSFGGVRMDTDFPVRVWQDGTADSVAIGAFGWSGTGKVAIAPQGGFSPQPGDRWTIGTQPASLAVPQANLPFAIRAEPIPGDDTRVRLVALVPKGLVILIQ